MRKILLGLLCALPLAAVASPFIISDPYPTTVAQPERCHLIVDALPDMNVPVTVNADASVFCKWDIASIANGTHQSTVTACNTLGCSTAVKFPFVKAIIGIPLAPVNLTIVP